MKKILYPTLVLLLVAVTVVQVKAMRGRDAIQPRELAAKPEPLIVAEGRLVAYPGAEITVSSDVAGTIDRLAVDEKQQVKKGDVIAVIRAHDLRAALAEARSRVAEAEADIRLFEADAQRAQSLFETEVGSKQAWQKALRDVDAARARRESALAEVRRLDAVVDKTVVTAPIDGVVIARNVDAGESIEAGEDIVTIADLARTRVEAEVDEFDTARVRLGATAEVKAEGFDGAWVGTIEEIPDAVVNRRLKPQDPSKPIDTRVLLVKIAFAEATPLKLGQRVEVRIK